jgi:two-component system, sensor histidine kinase LadS
LLNWRLPAGDNPRELWVRLSTTSTRMAHFEVLDAQSTQLSSARATFAANIYLGALILLIIWAVTQLLIWRDVLTASFLIYNVLALGFSAGILGLPRYFAPVWLSPNWADMQTNILSIASMWAAFEFARQLFVEIALPRWANLILRWIRWIFPCLLIGVVFGYERVALQINMTTILLLPAFLLLFIIFSKTQDLPPQRLNYGLNRRVVVTYFTVTLGLTLLMALPALGISPGNSISPYIALLYGFLSSLTMTAVLLRRAYKLRMSHAWFAQESVLLKALADQERMQKQEHAQLLDMLGHELKNPLATVRMLSGDQRIPKELSTRINLMVQDICLILDRLLQAGQFDDGMIATSYRQMDLADFLTQLLMEFSEQDRFVWIAREDIKGATTFSDPTLLAIIIRNLLDNALKYSLKDSVVELVVVKPDEKGFWSLSIFNLADKNLFPDVNFLFTKYYRSAAAKSRSGSGLGLYLVQKLAQRVGGEIRYTLEGDRVCFQFLMGPPRTTTL